MKIIAQLKGRCLRTLDDVSDGELLALLELAAGLKERRRAGVRGDLLKGLSIALVFEKMSTRTRCAASIAAADEAGRAEYLATGEIHLGRKESVADTARVLGRMFDGILFRGYLQGTVETLCRAAGVPVWNGLTDEAHPTQALADLLTIREHFDTLCGLKLVYIGDGRNNVATSLMRACAKTGMHFVNCTPPELAPPVEMIAAGQKAARRNRGSVAVVHDPGEALPGANVVYTDVWVSMGEEARFDERVRLLRPYQVTQGLINRTGNLADGRIVFLHCLPAFHDANTDVTRELGPLEVTDEVFEAPYSLVFEQAENRLHTMKAVFVATLKGGLD